MFWSAIEAHEVSFSYSLTPAAGLLQIPWQQGSCVVGFHKQGTEHLIQFEKVGIPFGALDGKTCLRFHSTGSQA